MWSWNAPTLVILGGPPAPYFTVLGTPAFAWSSCLKLRIAAPVCRLVHPNNSLLSDGGFHFHPDAPSRAARACVVAISWTRLCWVYFNYCVFILFLSLSISGRQWGTCYQKHPPDSCSNTSQPSHLFKFWEKVRILYGIRYWCLFILFIGTSFCFVFFLFNTFVFPDCYGAMNLTWQVWH